MTQTFTSTDRHTDKQANEWQGILQWPTLYGAIHTKGFPSCDQLQGKFMILLISQQQKKNVERKSGDWCCFTSSRDLNSPCANTQALDTKIFLTWMEAQTTEEPMSKCVYCIITMPQLWHSFPIAASMGYIILYLIWGDKEGPTIHCIRKQLPLAC